MTRTTQVAGQPAGGANNGGHCSSQQLLMSAGVDSGLSHMPRNSWVVTPTPEIKRLCGRCQPL